MGRFKILTVVWLAVAQVGLAQVGTSTLTGRVVDATDAAIPNAQVKVVNQDSTLQITVQYTIVQTQQKQTAQFSYGGPAP